MSKYTLDISMNRYFRGSREDYLTTYVYNNLDEAKADFKYYVEGHQLIENDVDASYYENCYLHLQDEDENTLEEYDNYLEKDFIYSLNSYGGYEITSVSLHVESEDEYDEN